MPTTAPTVAAASTPNRLRSPLAAAKPAKGMMSSDGIGGKIDSASMTRKMPRYPNSEMVWMIQSVMAVPQYRGSVTPTYLPHRGEVQICGLWLDRALEWSSTSPVRRRLGGDYADLAARLMRLRSLGSSQILRRRIDLGVTSTYSSSAM